MTPLSGASAARRRLTVSWAASPSGASFNVASTSTSPSTTLGASPGRPLRVAVAASDTPSTPPAVSATAAARPAGATMTAGCPEPPGKCSLSVACAATDGASFTKVSSSGTPLAFSCGAKRARPTRGRTVAIQSRRGWRSTRVATRFQIPRASASAGRGFAFAGHRAARPSRTRAAGRKVSALRAAHAMPMAPTGPSARLLVRLLSSSASSARATVAALATIGSNERRSATRPAAKRSPVVASSSGSGRSAATRSRWPRR